LTISRRSEEGAAAAARLDLVEKHTDAAELNEYAP
jgi:hypothetical protein